MAADGYRHGGPYHGSMTVNGADARSADTTPVLIFPGFTKCGLFMDDFAHQLAANLDDTYDVRNWEGPVVTGATRAVLKHARDKLHTAFAESGGQKVTIVGHSFGGLLGLVLAREFPDMVSHVVPLGTPVREFNIAAAAPLYMMHQAFDRTGEQMRLAADYRMRIPTRFMEFFSTGLDNMIHNMGVANRQFEAWMDQGMHHPDVLAQVEKPIDGVQITAIWSPTDQLVPARMTRIEESHGRRNVRVQTTGDKSSLTADHFDLVQSPDVIRTVAQAINGHGSTLPRANTGRAARASRAAHLVAEAI